MAKVKTSQENTAAGQAPAAANSSAPAAANPIVPTSAIEVAMQPIKDMGRTVQSKFTPKDQSNVMQSGRILRDNGVAFVLVISQNALQEAKAQTPQQTPATAHEQDVGLE